MMNVEKGIRPHIRFETRQEEDRAATVEKGQKVYRDVDWVIVTSAGSRDEFTNRAELWLANIRDRAQVGQYDPEWVEKFEKMYALFKQGKEMPEDGTPLRMCATMFSPAEIQTCLDANVRTLEQLAAANEDAIGRMSMMGRALKTRAQEALKISEGRGGAIQMEALQVENAELKRQVDLLMGKVNQLLDERATGEPETKPRRGRPPQNELAA